MKCLNEALDRLKIEDILDKDAVLGGRPTLVGGGSDGASVNVGQHTGMRAKIQSALPWIFWSWCFAHRLELASKDSLKSKLFNDIQETLLRLYYLYEKSPKKTRELSGIVDDLKEVFELPQGGNIPIRSQGFHWMNHKRNALQRVVDRYGAYISHLSTLVENKSIARGYLATLLSGHMQRF